jgi:hypothetical protein
MWQSALGPKARIFFKLCEALVDCAAAPGAPEEEHEQRRLWAVDLACGPRTGPQPKFFVVATTAVFVGAYLACSHRHAYEVLESTRGCFLYFDLELGFTSAAQLALAQEAGRCVAATAAVVLAELAALREPDAPSPPHFDFLMLDATRPIEGELPGKYSAHLVCRMWRDGAPWLLRGPVDAGAVARGVGERLIAKGHPHAAELIDLAVYGDRRAFRLLGSTKLMDARSRPLQQLDGGGAPLSAADVLASLVAPAIQPPILPPATIPSAAQSIGARMRPAPALPRLAKVQRCEGAKACEGRDGPAVAHGRWWPRHTEMPLLDTPRLPHRAIARRLTGKPHEVPAPLKALHGWAAEQLKRFSGGAAVSWRYERASMPAEALLHITGSARGVCAHIERAHTSWKTMVTVDILNGIAWQRCWDQQCVRVVSERAYVKARHTLGAVPEDCLPGQDLMELSL